MSPKLLTNHLLLPGTCRKCGKRNYYWLDGTYGCENGHIYARHDPSLDYSQWEWVEAEG